ncbi:MAG: hypothetical protein HYX32_14725 [Actinobacteria bacterium]|nr:hypothetical protein [Actinomycetota bacterium]
MVDTDRQAGEPEDQADDLLDMDLEVIERAVLNDSEEGRTIQAGFVEHFGAFMVEVVRPILVDVAADGGQPQLLVNGLAELMRSVADRIEFPLDHPRSGFPPQMPEAG